MLKTRKKAHAGSRVSKLDPPAFLTSIFWEGGFFVSTGVQPPIATNAVA